MSSSHLEQRVLRARIDGAEFVASEQLYAQFQNGVLAIAARSTDGRTIYLTFVTDLRRGPVNVGEGSPNSAITTFRQGHWRSNLPGGTGSVTIALLRAGGIDGSFSFTAVPLPTTSATGRRVVTGTFSVDYE